MNGSDRWSRTARGTSHGIALTARDFAILNFLAGVRYATTEQIARDLFASVDRARDRLRRLYNARLVAVTLTDSRAPNLISLTRSGARELASGRPEMADEIHLAGTIRLAAITHHLTVVDARLYARSLGARRDTPLVRWGGPGGDLAKELGLPPLHVEPDGLAEFAVGAERVVIALEADCNQESGRVLSSKLERYVAVAAAGRIDALWFVVDGGDARRAMIGRLADENALGEWVRVLSRPFVVGRPVAELPARSGTAAGTGGGARVVAEGQNTTAAGPALSSRNHGVQTSDPAVARRVDGRVARRG